MCLQRAGRVDEEEEKKKKRLSGLCFVGGERKLREKKKGSYRCRLFFSPLTIFWLGVKADTAVLSILAHFPLLCVCVCVCQAAQSCFAFCLKRLFRPRRTFHPRSNRLLKSEIHLVFLHVTRPTDPLNGTPVPSYRHTTNLKLVVTVERVDRIHSITETSKGAQNDLLDASRDSFESRVSQSRALSPWALSSGSVMKEQTTSIARADVVLTVLYAVPFVRQ